MYRLCKNVLWYIAASHLEFAASAARDDRVIGKFRGAKHFIHCVRRFHFFGNLPNEMIYFLTRCQIKPGCDRSCRPYVSIYF